MDLSTPLKRVLGAPRAGPLAATLDLHTVGDLLRHYPRRYAERGRLTGFDELVIGEHATVFAEVELVKSRQIREKLSKTDVTVVDGEGRRMTMAMFNRYKARTELRAGRRAFFAGKVERFNNSVQLANPEYQLVDDDDGQVAAEFAGGLVPIYPASAKVSTLKISRCIGVALDGVDIGAEPMPLELLKTYGLVGLMAALRGIHTPEGWADVKRAKKRLTWDEAFVLQVTLAQRRAMLRATPGTARKPRPGGLLARFDSALRFELTAGQRAVGDVLLTELADSAPMHRLLQGEVGSGKTLVALRAMLAVVDAGGQAALLAPTEVLAQQHDRSLRQLLGPLAQAGELGAADDATRVALLTGSLGAAARRSALAQAASGEAGLVVGTHALLGEHVAFADLGLVVVDEQHRFGVEQRDALRGKGVAPHVLVMTATPIPRTVAMTVYGDLEVSTLTELPLGRSPIRSAVVAVAEHPGWLDRAWQRVREAVGQGRQAFVVCPRIGGDDADEDSGPDQGAGLDDAGRRPAVAVAELEPLLAAGPLAGLRTAQLHGRLAPEAKDEVMRRVVAGEVDVLVATTVIEVGVDVPNATVMVVMDADRFGLSQLHQLRGRIGRGRHPGLCLLVTEAEEGSPARRRTDAVAATTDGFALSELDLEQRREGDVLGASQSGRRSSLRMLQLLRDTDVIVTARAAAVELVDADPELAHHPALAGAVATILDEERAAYLEKA